MNVGIIGAGWIAEKMALTIKGLKDPTIKAYAIAARDKDRAEAFARQWGFEWAYGSYAEMVADPAVDLVYVATPHSHHFEHASLALNAGKAVLCEKALTANAREARELVALARERGLLLAEAIWTRYMPLSLKVSELIASGAIGRPRLLSASLCYAMEQKERILRPDLCGGALLDLGVYCLNFARMYFGTDIVGTDSSCVIGETGTDMYENITLRWADGKMAALQASALSRCNREGMISGDDGYIVVDSINCPEAVRVYRDYTLCEEYLAPEGQVTGYEYELLACRDALAQGLTETPFMPLDESISIMEEMDALRRQWGVVYPMDD